MKNKIAVIGAGISGISVAKMLINKADVTVFEQNKIGGLVRCDRVEDILYHRVGGHVFNSKNTKVLDWFWSFFDKKNEFIKANRFAQVFLGNKYIDYPIEDHLFQLDNSLVENIVSDLLKIPQDKNVDNFEDFLISTFGESLYKLYFRPYNKKIWNVDLSEVPLDWLSGKLPMPNVKDIIVNNILRQQENQMVHATFFYPKYGGSQFIIDRLADNLTLIENHSVKNIIYTKGKIFIDELGPFDKVIYTGDVRKLSDYLSKSISLLPYKEEINALKSNGTTNILCKCDDTNLSWLYIPEEHYKAHRIIYTGNFSDTNNDISGRSSCTVEFSNFITQEEAKRELKNLPGNLEFVSYNYEPNSYVIQDNRTRSLIIEIKEFLKQREIFLLGRFAEWEYNNMDKCIESAMKLVEEEIGI